MLMKVMLDTLYLKSTGVDVIGIFRYFVNFLQQKSPVVPIDLPNVFDVIMKNMETVEKFSIFCVFLRLLRLQNMMVNDFCS